MRTKYLALLPLLAGCASGPTLHTDDALAAEKLEVALDSNGMPTEIEYHVNPAAVPEAVHAAMNALHPGGAATGAEKEYEGDDLYWELSKDVGGFKIEAMFAPDGTLHSEEVEVPASKVPEAVRATVTGACYGAVRAWEEIHDGDQTLVEYHAKTSKDGRNYKLLVGTGGDLLAVYREIESEIEVPVE